MRTTRFTYALEILGVDVALLDNTTNLLLNFRVVAFTESVKAMLGRREHTHSSSS
jgi:hypothetical protein